MIDYQRKLRSIGDDEQVIELARLFADAVAMGDFDGAATHIHKAEVVRDLIANAAARQGSL